MFDVRSLLAVILAAAIPLAAVPASPAGAAEAIRIGELNSYTGLPAFTVPYRHGWRLGLEEINAAGGVLARRNDGFSRRRKPSTVLPLGVNLKAILSI